MVDSFGVSRVSVRRFGPAPASVARRLWPPGSYFNPFEVLDDEWAQDLLPPMINDPLMVADNSEDDDAPEDPRSEASSSSGPENPAALEDSEDDSSISGSAVLDPFFDLQGDSDTSIELGSEDTVSVVSSDEGFVSGETESMDEDEYEPPSPISSGEEWLPDADDMGDSDSE
jgi:hypothetical protein